MLGIFILHSHIGLRHLQIPVLILVFLDRGFLSLILREGGLLSRNASQRSTGIQLWILNLRLSA